MKETNSDSDLGLGRFNEINRYPIKFVMEQEVPAAPAAPAAPAPEEELPPPPGGGEMPPPPEEELPPEGEPGAEADAEVPPEAEPSTEDDTTEEIDITDLVNMVKDVKKHLDEPKQEDPTELQKMDDVFAKLSDLEARLGEMDSVLSKIDELGAEIQDMKPKTPVEKLEMRSLDSYPFNETPVNFFNDKQEEMKKSGKNEYVLTKDDIENYGKYDMMKSFNPAADDRY